MTLSILENSGRQLSLVWPFLSPFVSSVFSPIVVPFGPFVVRVVVDANSDMNMFMNCKGWKILQNLVHLKALLLNLMDFSVRISNPLKTSKT